MITFKPVVAPSARRKDGTYPVRIRVTFRSQVRRLPTTLTCTDADITRSGKIKNPDILNKAEALAAQMRQAASGISPYDLEGADVDFVVRRIKDALSADTFRLDFYEFAEGYIKTKTEGTRTTYRCAITAMRRHFGDRIDINDITRTGLRAFIDGPHTQHLKGHGTLTGYISKLSAIYDAARERYNDEDRGLFRIPRDPFKGLRAETNVIHEGQRSLDIATMQRIINERPASEAQALALDLFCLSFCLMGANFSDLWEAVPPTGEWWVYNRRKTRARRADKAEMRVLIPPQALRLAERLKNSKCKGYWLGALHHRRSQNKNVVMLHINVSLHRYQDSAGLPEFTFYAARHTWATLARRIGIEKATIDECLAHVGDFAIADIYAERNWELINDANRRVLELFEWGNI